MNIAHIDESVYYSEECQDWLYGQRVNGAKIEYWPCMDNSDYGMHFCYGFHDPEVYALFKLKFATLSKPWGITETPLS